MEPTQYYAIFLSSAFLLLGLRAFLLFLRHSMLACLKDLFTRKLRYPLLVRLVEITRLQTLVLVLYLGLNSLALALGLSATDIRGFEQRAATLAIINIIPMYLGGLANPLADLVGIPLSLHHLLHVWIGRVVIIEGLIHAVLAVILRPLPGPITISGYLVALLFLLLLLSTIAHGSLHNRKYLKPWSRIIRVVSPRIHLALAVSTVALTLWHVFLLTSTQARVLVSIAAGLWVLGVMYRWGMIYFYGTRATVSDIWWDGSVISFDVHTERSVRVRPGGYFYLFLPGSIFRYHFFSSFPVVALWQNPENFQSVQAVGNVKDMSFIISRSKHTRRLEQLDRGQKVLLHGPYGRDLQLESSENVILAAKGIGILGVLQFAFSIAMRKYYDDRIRRDLRSLRRLDEKRRSDKRKLVERRKRLLLPADEGYQSPKSKEILLKRAEKLLEIEEELKIKQSSLRASVSTGKEKQAEELEREILRREKEALELKKDRLQIEVEIFEAEEILNETRVRRQQPKTSRKLNTLKAERLATEKNLVEVETDLLAERERFLLMRKAILMAKPLFCDSVRQVDIFWILDDNSQAFWIAKQINALQELDPEKVLLVFWCMNPTPQSGSPPFKESTHFRCYYPRPGMPSYDKLVIKKIQEESRSPGKIAVIGCGESAFIGNIRSGIVNTMNRVIRFVESEFRPSGGQRRPQRLVTVGLADLTTVGSEKDSSSSPETSEDEEFTL